MSQGERKLDRGCGVHLVTIDWREALVAAARCLRHECDCVVCAELPGCAVVVANGSACAALSEYYDPFPTLTMRNEHQATFHCIADSYFPVLIKRMVGIRKGHVSKFTLSLPQFPQSWVDRMRDLPDPRDCPNRIAQDSVAC